MKIPGPDHPITIVPNPKRVRVLFNGRVVADTVRALTLKEASLPSVQYIPREDADMARDAGTSKDERAGESRSRFRDDTAGRWPSAGVYRWNAARFPNARRRC
jgi:hypothetical protein